jgi:hypothetical protein
MPYSNPALALEGAFKETRKCSQTGDTSINVTISPVDGMPSKVNIRGIWVGGGTYTVTANVHQSSQTVTLPKQTVNKLIFQGTGTFSKKRMELSYSVVDSAHGLVNDNCTSVFIQD